MLHRAVKIALVDPLSPTSMRRIPNGHQTFLLGETLIGSVDVHGAHAQPKLIGKQQQTTPEVGVEHVLITKLRQIRVDGAFGIVS